MHKHLLLTALVAICLLLIQPASVTAQTIPTRTPTPSSGGGGGGATATAPPFIAPTGSVETSTPQPSSTPIPANTAIPTWTPSSTNTPVPSWTPSPVNTAVPTWTPTPLATMAPSTTPVPTWTRTPIPTNVPQATATTVPTNTSVPTWTPSPSETPAPTWTPLPDGAQQPTWTPRPPHTPVPTWTLEPSQTPNPTIAAGNGGAQSTPIQLTATITPLPSTSGGNAGGQGSGASCNLNVYAWPLLDNVLLRTGPDTAYDVLMVLNKTDRVQILARYGFGEWWFVERINDENQRGWIADLTVRVDGYVNLLPELDAPFVEGVELTRTPRWQITPAPQSECRCGLRPIVQVFVENANVRSEPSTAASIVEVLPYLSIRPIHARYGFAEWWQIELDNGQLGWISEEIVTVYGHSGLVPVLASEQVSAELTPGPLWQPTPHPDCPNPPPTLTATPTAISTVEATGETIDSTPTPAETTTAALTASSQSAEIVQQEAPAATLTPILTPTPSGEIETTSETNVVLTVVATPTQAEADTSDEPLAKVVSSDDDSVSQSADANQTVDTQGNTDASPQLEQQGRVASNINWQTQGMLSLCGGLIIAGLGWGLWLIVTRRREHAIIDEEL